MLPTYSGTSADQDVEPDAVPPFPLEVVHFTEATPTLSLALPATRMDAAEVETIVTPGDVIDRLGAVVSLTGGGEGGDGEGGETGG